MTGNTFNNRVYLNRKMTKLFIQLYKENTCLYDPSHEHYHSRIPKNESLNNILVEMQKFVPDLQLENIRCKIKTIRTQFAHELTILEAMQKAGIAYTPKLWCFQQLSFLRKFMSRLPNNEEKACLDDQLPYDDDSDSNDGGKSFYRELADTDSLKRPIRPRRINFKWTREITELFIKLYKKHKCLYDPKHEDFGDRWKTDEARDHLLREMKQFVPWICMQDIWAKRKCLRDQYGRELKLLAMAKQNNTDYEPKLWCFHLLSYLKPLKNRDLAPQGDEESDNTSSEIEFPSGNEDTSDIEDDDFQDANTVFDEDKEHSNGSDDTVYDETDFDECDEDLNNAKIASPEVIATDENKLIVNKESEIEIIADNMDEIEYDESILTSRSNPIVELISNDFIRNDDEIIDSDSNQNANKMSFLSEKVKIERVEYSSPQEKHCSTTKNSKSCESACHSRYDWLGQFVVSQLDEISPSHLSDFVWDVQRLVRKYKLKTDLKNYSAGSSKKSRRDSEEFTENWKLPRSSNVSLNISFL